MDIEALIKNIEVDNNIKPINKTEDYINTNGAETYFTPSWSYLVKGESILKKDFLCAIGSIFFILDYKGQLKSWFDFRSGNTLVNEGAIISNPKEIAPNIYTILLTFCQNKHIGALLVVSIKDNKLKILNKYSLISTKSTSPYDLNTHVCYIKDSNDIYLLSVKAEDQKVFSNEVLQEQKDGKVVWQWESKDFIKQLSACSIRNKKDYGDLYNEICHLNGIEELDDTHLIMSLRSVGIICLNKSTNSIEWVIGEKRNDLGFRDLPKLQHGLEWINPEHTKFVTFNNNWLEDSPPIKAILADSEAYRATLDIRTNSQIIIYDLENKISKAYDTGIPASPRQGNVIHIKDNIFDINYGQCLSIKDNIIYQHGLVEEKDLTSNKIYFSLQFPFSPFNISRGL